MKIIVPMAGRGSRLRPHTLTVPKPLIPVAGKSIVHRLVEDIAKILKEPIEEVAFILGDEAFFGADVVESLEDLAKGLGAKASIYRQDQPLGTGHAIMCAKDSLSGPAVIAYADTLIRADFELDPSADAVIWVKQVEQPEAFGVVKLNQNTEIIELVEKPKEFVSDLAVIGIYYFKEVGDLKKELQGVLDNNIQNGGEYQINDGIKAMMANGKVFKTGSVDEWMDCGNKDVTVETNTRMLGFLHNDGEHLVDQNVVLDNSTIIPPCFIGENVVLKNTTIGPNVSIGNGCHVTDSTIKNSLIQTYSQIKNANLDNAMIGNHVSYDGKFTSISIGDYSVLE
ncbi:sugar phosphate nucleotidyltransferase [Flavobacterium johnsoniae]|jgi:glucose-1-phosphate thymidylyltransferase|uniref:Nucleotidyl transferase n=1 Tax=Flavobacterium johnsoniae (strain ATCC 17061 / DSM 2064 / JCM 8514 / BCRC 14874 / CCUG 350202 / NBRC 14942 / NCIMB 11054 / UW101) TaxID=376686 RepID=A5FL23_FLAJ1|nr:sugar phosphate nucleotidyltransferase [Flavobacterium johnsoniae]ABQ04097.1 Nucleotidyl transferase [Flavobacterium johnsoniae UW101]OXG02669.1 nucleotidyltransferase [Flavobacterium johnsoniae UW101]WQG79032.1 sugar phosphate nucleotidyltransferase [Flavobacterium johnsoniae UW101]SHK12249.1 glucose-1-phosphate thymidylyltransferase [Flavobacterium johnsoniae]